MFLIKVRRLTPLLIASTGAVALTKEIKGTSQENNTVATIKESNLDVFNKSTGWDRIKTIFEINEYGERSPDFALIVTSIGLGTMIGVVMGAIRRSRKTLTDFMEQNDATKFQNITEARRHLGRLLTKEMLKGVWEYAPTFAFLCGGFMFTGTVVAAYRAKTGILEHIVAGIVIGGLYRFNYGVRGMIVGMTTGSIFGSIYGVSTYLLFKITGNDLEKARKDFHNLYYYGDRKWKKSRAEYEMKNEMSYIERVKAEKTRNLPLTLDPIDPPQKETA